MLLFSCSNPLFLLFYGLSVALLLRHSLGLEAEAAAVEAAVQQTIETSCRTPDLGGSASTGEVGARVAEYIGR